MKNLIMGAATGYGWDVLEPFVTSCKLHCPDAELVLFTGDLSDFTRDKLIQSGVTLEHFPDEPRGIPNNTRWKIFGDWLEAHGDEFEQVFITDTRDVIFQGDIFAPSAELTNWLGVATEADDIGGTKTGDKINYSWICDCFGAAEADKLADQKIICDGTVIGSIDAMKIFCRELYELVVQVEARVKIRIHDQAVANYLVRTNRLPVKNLIELDTDSGEIFTAGLFMLKGMRPIEIRGDKILRGDGGVPAIVHQYDRLKELLEFVDKIYRDQNFQADVRFSDVRSVIEQATYLLTADKVEAAAQLFIGKLSVVENLSDCVEALLRLWENAMRKTLTKASGDIELAVQSVLKTVKNFSAGETEKICRYLKLSHDGHHLVDAEFENFLTRSLLYAARQTLAAGEIEKHRYCANLLKIFRHQASGGCGMKNLIMGAATGYGWDVLEPFVTSCRRYCPDAELVLFTGDLSDFTCDKLIQSGVTLEHFPDEPRGIPNNTRWKIFGDWLEAHGDEFEQVFVTDTRDVIFQGDIFAPFSGLTNWLGLATEADDLGGSHTGENMNFLWLTECFGAAEAERLADQKIICSGTVIGSIDAMKIFCRELWKILAHKTTNIFDQAATNYLAWHGLLPIENVFEIDVDGGEIFTTGLFMLKGMRPIEIRGDKILRGDGGVPAIVHQYDRSTALVELVDKIYRDKNFQADVRFDDVQSAVEQTACLLYADKVADAAKLFMKKFLSPADFNAAKNSLIIVWELAAKKNFAPTVELLELAAQNALTSVKKFSDGQMLRMHKIFLDAEKNHHAIDPTFKKNFAARLLKIGEQCLAAGAPTGYVLNIVRLIMTLNLEPDEKFLQFAARVNQALKR